MLDLEDPRGFDMAKHLDDEARLINARDSILATNCYPAFTAVTSFDMVNNVISAGWQTNPLPEGKRFMALISDGRLAVCQLPDSLFSL